MDRPRADPGHGLVVGCLDRALTWGAALAGRGEEALGNARRTLSFVRGRRAMQPRKDDIYVVSYPRSGTTWMQLMLHRLVGRDEVDFTHISQVSPWFERSLAIGSMCARDFEAFPSPRIMKSHLSYGYLPSPGRYIYMWRDGRDVALSYFHFYQSHLGFRDDFAAFFRRFLRGDLQYRSWFDHVDGWLGHADDAGVLPVRYEDLHRDRAAVLRRVAEHLGLSVSEDRLTRVLAETTFDWMKAQETKFDHSTALLLERRARDGAFLRHGVAGDGHRELSLAEQAAFERRMLRSAAKPWPHTHLAAFLH